VKPSQAKPSQAKPSQASQCHSLLSLCGIVVLSRACLGKANSFLFLSVSGVFLARLLIQYSLASRSVESESDNQ
jgi:hypothetical protein